MENLEYQCLFIIALASVCVNVFVCVQFNGFCLCELNQSVPRQKARQAAPTDHTLLWLAHAHNRVQASWSPYILASCVFSN